jgi:SAM-dependent methyltransferase
MTTTRRRPPRRYRADGRPAITLSGVQSRQRERFLQRVADGTYHWEAVPTCLCGSEEAIPLSEKDRFGFPVGVVACGRCGLVRTSPRLAAENLPTFYDLDYHALHQSVLNPTSNTALFRKGQGTTVYNLLRRHLPKGRLLVAEIGAGTGGVLREFAVAARHDGRDVDLIGCEYARDFVEVGRAVGTDLREGGAEALIGMPPFDVLIMSHVLEHFPDPITELVRIRQLLKPGAIVYVEVPGLLTLHKKREYEFDLLEYLTLAHTFHFSRQSIIQTMRRAGFEVVSADETVRSVFVSTGIDASSGAIRFDHSPSDARELLTYVAWLDSRAMRYRRVPLRVANESKRRLKRLLQSLLGERIWVSARSAWRLRGRPHLPKRA